MESQENDSVGTVDVRVDKKAIYKAIQNILANEYKLDPEQIKIDTRKWADTKIQEEVINYISKSGYDKANLYEQVKRAIDHKIADLTPIVKEVVKSLVQEKIREEIEGVLKVIIQTGMEVSIGYNRKVKVKVNDADAKQTNSI